MLGRGGVYDGLEDSTTPSACRHSAPELGRQIFSSGLPRLNAMPKTTMSALEQEQEQEQEPEQSRQRKPNVTLSDQESSWGGQTIRKAHAVAVHAPVVVVKQPQPRVSTHTHTHTHVPLVATDTGPLHRSRSFPRRSAKKNAARAGCVSAAPEHHPPRQR